MDRYRTHYAWQEAAKLGLILYRLADDLPGDEQHLLAHDLRRAAVEVPTLIAQNILAGQPADLSALIKLQNVMELIGKVYPALDTSDAEDAVNTLAGRLSDQGRFMETVPAPAAAPVAADDEEGEDNEDDAPEAHIGVNQE